MKRYKLKKDCYGFGKDTEFTYLGLDKFGILDNVRGITVELTEEYIDVHSDEFEPIEDDTEDLFWRPEVKKIFYYINHLNIVKPAIWTEEMEYEISSIEDTRVSHFFNETAVKALFDSGNCFKTKAEAQREADKILARRKIEAFARKRNGNNKNLASNWHIYWHSYDENFHTSKSFLALGVIGGYYFRTEKDAHDCIKLFEKELKLLMWVE